MGEWSNDLRTSAVRSRRAYKRSADTALVRATANMACTLSLAFRAAAFTATAPHGIRHQRNTRAVACLTARCSPCAYAHICASTQNIRIKRLDNFFLLIGIPLARKQIAVTWRRVQTARKSNVAPP